VHGLTYREIALMYDVSLQAVGKARVAQWGRAA
jgi:DNA-directed RNA polymerase specialized sigma24 family protein